MKLRLSLSFLGPFQASLDGRKVEGFKSIKVRALLAYLAVEADRPHSRETLAGLLWPDWSDREALSNLRFALSNLRQAIGDPEAEPPYLLITRESLQFNTQSDYWLDVAAFTQQVNVDRADPTAMDQLQGAVGLVQGSFLEGFSVYDSSGFEEWLLLKREDVRRQLSSALHWLAENSEQRGEYEQAQAYAWRGLELEPWDEAAHQLLMRTLALSGQRSAALAQYQTCRRTLAEELQIEPSEATTRLYERIRDGKLSSPAPAQQVSVHAELPAFLSKEAPTAETPVFVARQGELSKLNGMLELARLGQGRVAFVTGEAGSGKSALLWEFSRQALEQHLDLCVAGGNCNAYTGIGDPYLPFREMLELLTGDVRAKVAAGAITQETARRLWRLIPQAVRALLELGPDLVDTFVHRAPLLDRAGTYKQDASLADWLNRLTESAERKPIIAPGPYSPQQINLFEQYTRVLQSLAQSGPLLLILDDLQWADLGSISLLFHLGRHLAGNRILILGAYRPEEIALGREGARHPLETVVNELRRNFGDIQVDLEQAENWGFLEALLDREPNRLGAAFREMLFRQTHGLPLFTIELLRGMQERSDLVKDADGRWVEGLSLNWESLPERVEAVVAERIGRLAPPLQSVLRIACVEGEQFIAEVIARVQAVDEREMLGYLSGELDRTHRLIQAQSILRVNGQRLSRYRFQHFLFQKYLYSSLDEVERVSLHEQVGMALEGLYAVRGESVAEETALALQLARHFQEAGITEKAIHYLRQAGERAVRLYAYQDGITHLTKALDLLMTLPESPERDQKELALQINLGIAWIGETPGPERGNALTRARELCYRSGKTNELSQVLGELSTFHYVRAEYEKARELAEEALALAQQTINPLLALVGHWILGFVNFSLGEFTTAQAHLREVVSFYEPQQHRHFLLQRGSDIGPSALAYEACCLWCLGYPDQALQLSQQALALARQFDHAFTSADVVCFGGCVFNTMRREPVGLKETAQELIRISEGMGFSSFWGTGECYLGEALTRSGELQEGMAQIRRGLAIRQGVHTWCHQSGMYGALAEAQAETGELETGLGTLAKALTHVQATNERYCEAELHRRKGEMLLQQCDPEGAEASFQHAIQVAHTQQAKSWELRAALSLARLWQSQGKHEAARQALGEVYNWFSEGFDTPDLMEARALLDEIRI